MTYALRGCSRALLAGPEHALASCSQVAAGGGRWLLTAGRGHLGDTPPPPNPARSTGPGLPHPPGCGRRRQRRGARGTPAAPAQDAGWWKNRAASPQTRGPGRQPRRGQFSGCSSPWCSSSPRCCAWLLHSACLIGSRAPVWCASADLPFFRPGISPVGPNRASVMRCGWSVDDVSRWLLLLLSPLLSAGGLSHLCERTVRDRNRASWTALLVLAVSRIGANAPPFPLGGSSSRGRPPSG